jgi:hypothetical protein
MYFQRNWEFGSALSNLWISKSPPPPPVRHCRTETLETHFECSEHIHNCSTCVMHMYKIVSGSISYVLNITVRPCSLVRSSSCGRIRADSHIPCRFPAANLPWPWEVAFRTAYSWHGMACVNKTRPHYVNQMGKTQSKPLTERHGMCESAFTVSTRTSRCRSLVHSRSRLHFRAVPYRIYFDRTFLRFL